MCLYVLICAYVCYVCFTYTYTYVYYTYDLPIPMCAYLTSSLPNT